jgi:hypothetical protein
MKNKYDNLKILKKRLKIISYIIFIQTLLLIQFLPSVSAAGDDATFDSIDVNVVPPVQGVGGEIKVEVSAHFFGGCCYHLYANDVTATISEPGNDNVPESVQVLSPLKQSVKQVDAAPGGKATTKTFAWIITSEVPETYDLEVKVSTSNCGTESSIVQVIIVEGASISPQELFPSKPSVNEAITFSAVVKSGSDFIEIEKTSLYIWHSEKNYHINSLKAEEEKLYKMRNNDNSNMSSSINENITTQFLDRGETYQMKHEEFSEIWRTQVKDFNKEEYIYYWYNVKTSDGKNTTSFVYKKRIEDLERKYQMLETVKWGTFLISTIGIILILGISWKYFDRPAKGVDKVGIFILGSKFFSKPKDGKRSNISQLSIERFRFSLLIIFIIIALTMLAFAIYFGLFQDLITETGG